MSKPPTWIEVLGALALIEAWLELQVAWLRERWTGDPEVLDRLAEMLKVKKHTLESLTAVVMELQTLVAGAGPVEHDPVDFAYDPDVDTPETPPGA